MFTSSAKEAINQRERVKAVVNDIHKGSRRVKREMRDMADDVREDLDIGSMAHAVGEQMGKFVDDAGESLAHAKETIVEATGSAAERIRENPLTATAVAMGVGVMLGVLLRRR
jgi:ElaB/YqjD/DUF883 family membrane-anchored ribosome-binding protein